MADQTKGKATSNLDPPIDIGSKEGFKDTITSSIVKELSKKAYTILDNSKLSGESNFKQWIQALTVLLMLLRDSLSSGPRAAISWIYIPSKAFKLLVRQYSRPIESKKEDVHNEFHALTFSTYKQGLSAFNAKFNGYLIKLTIAKIDIDPSLMLNYLNIEYLIADILEESRNLAIEAYRAAHVANSSNSTPNSIIVESTWPTISIRKPELSEAFPQSTEPIFAPKPIEVIAPNQPITNEPLNNSDPISEGDKMQLDYYKLLAKTSSYILYNRYTVADLGPKLSNSSNITTKFSREFHSKEGPRPLTTTSTTIVDSRNGKGSSWTSIINRSLVPIGFSDSDFAGDKATSKSTYGYLYKLASRPISWKTKRATTIALSTLEAEINGLTEAIREV
ncbi:hypothetical protein P8C59_001674 [Phyllachora maydis]|uniref:Uncharacterized protein n=1 Tax=Phyllachora maydis TaxID=1825666 RepID=A0AAD9HZT2_9PEZI|nr:hypothetical protein P8C59_001674 [Phyllachora maydis]